MRRYWGVLAAAGAVVALAACNGGGTTGSGATAGAESAATGPPPGCVTGAWRSTSVAANISGNVQGAPVNANLNGGEGILLKVAPDGMMRVDFGGMRPVDFAVTSSGHTVRGQFYYSGTASGRVGFGAGAQPNGTASPMVSPNGTASPTVSPNGTPSPMASPTGTASPTRTATATQTATATATPQASGVWEPTGPVDWSGTRITLKLTEPQARTVLNNAPVSGASGNPDGQVGNAVDLRPVLRAARYTCADGTLGMRPFAQTSAAWVFRRS